jgi:hypothetical protein
MEVRILGSGYLFSPQKVPKNEVDLLHQSTPLHKKHLCVCEYHQLHIDEPQLL